MGGAGDTDDWVAVVGCHQCGVVLLLLVEVGIVPGVESRLRRTSERMWG